jgi:acylphosphatase
VTPPGVQRFVARVSGRVQGVGFRYFVCQRAEALGVAGSVRNLPAGSVEVEAEGPRNVLETLLRELHEGPPHAQVADVSVEWHPPAGAREFHIRM